ncbi:hypothetical protein NDU88_008627 [Pleurodeles waltl]|uniref:alpha-N-acetylgalactosaminide alpha-2,6-sialyltransferase n=1 Tax=Pleurodeles waltl TaxID=8319 RepID=A0AAV7PWQ3_PLEWA|nr:hypothetical protein NDU88_008627 [Pleurodeles waltl]
MYYYIGQYCIGKTHDYLDVPASVFVDLGKSSFQQGALRLGSKILFEQPATVRTNQENVNKREKVPNPLEAGRANITQEKTSSSCINSLKAKLKKDSQYGSLFNLDVPVLMWDKHLKSWDRLKKWSPPYGWKDISQSVVSSTLKLLNHSANSWMFDAKQQAGCVRCAVVGNGGILNGSRQGKAIDAHDFVFRLNGAVIEGFQDDVGTKTSFYGFTVNTMKNSLIAYQIYGFKKVPQSKDLRYIFIPSDLRDYMMLKSAILGVKVSEGKDVGDIPQSYFGPEASAHKFKILHPDFIKYLTDRFLKSNLLKSQYANLYMPSTGALMLLTALHTCDQVSAYGFITDKYKDFSDHYYELVKTPLLFYANHDMLLESVLWKSLHQRGLLWLYQR